MYPVGIWWANCFRTHHELTMYPLGKCPLAPSVSSPERAQQLFRAEVELAQAHPTPASGRAGNPSTEAQRDAEKATAGALVSLRDARRANAQDLPTVDPRSQSGKVAESANNGNQEYLPRKIHFIQGGIVCGTAEEGPAEKEGAEPQDQHNGPMKETQVLTKKTSDPQSREDHDVNMEQGYDSDESLPDLSYPSSDDDDDNDDQQRPQQSVQAHEHGMDTMPTSTLQSTAVPTPSTGMGKGSDAFTRRIEFGTPLSPTVDYRTWKENLEPIKKALKEGAEWSDARIRTALDRIGMATWWFTLRKLN